MSTSVIASIVGVLALATVLFAAPDFAAIPPDAANVEAAIKATKIDLAKAIEIAKKSTGGTVASAAFNTDANASSIDLIVFSKGAKRHLVIDSASGSVTTDEVVSRFPGLAVSGNWMENDSGLKYFDIVVGDGPTPSGPASKVKVHYTGYLNDGTKFDSSVDRGAPATFPLNGVIAGWTEGVGSMRVGGKRKLIIPSSLGYGQRGAPGVIPPGATLIFDVELLEIVSE